MAKHEIAVMDKTGDTRTAWDPEDQASMVEAQAVFDKVRADGHIVYKADPVKGNEIVRAFDPTAELLVAVPALSGG